VCDFSAADDYIVRYFSAEGSQVLRIYDRRRRPQTVPAVVKKFCKMNDKGYFVDPSSQDILQNKIIMTTMVTSLQLTELQVQGYFTHILIDEAAQVHSNTLTQL